MAHMSWIWGRSGAGDWGSSQEKFWQRGKLLRKGFNSKTTTKEIRVRKKNLGIVLLAGLFSHLSKGLLQLPFQCNRKREFSPNFWKVSVSCLIA